MTVGHCWCVAEKTVSSASSVDTAVEGKCGDEGE